MDLPFVVNQIERDFLSQSSSSLVTASSQGSLQSSQQSYEPLKNADTTTYTNEARGIKAVFSQFGLTTQSSGSSAPRNSNNNNNILSSADSTSNEAEVIDFTYVNVCDTDADEVDVIIPGVDSSGDYERPIREDILTFLLSPPSQAETDKIAKTIEDANKSVEMAGEAKKNGDMQRALNCHASAAKYFHEASLLLRDCDSSLTESLLLLSQRQAKTALTLKQIVKLQPGTISFPSSKDLQISSQQDRLRATVRGALDKGTEADMSDSVFLGRSSRNRDVPTNTQSLSAVPQQIEIQNKSKRVEHLNKNPVDEMMELERELRNMDLALQMGLSIASVDARAQNRTKPGPIDGSFLVVPPDASSFMSSSMYNASKNQISHRSTSGSKANTMQSGQQRKNRVSNLIGASNSRAVASVKTPAIATVTNSSSPITAVKGNSLESSWWGNASTASVSLSSSVISLASMVGNNNNYNNGNGHSSTNSAESANTKQLMRLMDSLKTLGDENAALLREVESAEAARQEAKAVKEQLERFKEEYAKRFASLKAALEKFREDHSGQHNVADNNTANPVTSSEFVKTKLSSEQLQRQEQLIKKLTADLKKEKDEGKKKDATLKKYESFYREVKARSAQKAAQRQREELRVKQQKKF